MLILSFWQFFKTKPLPCDPSSLPEYPPSKEIDAKLREEEARKYVLIITPFSDIVCTCSFGLALSFFWPRFQFLDLWYYDKKNDFVNFHYYTENTKRKFDKNLLLLQLDFDTILSHVVPVFA